MPRESVRRLALIALVLVGCGARTDLRLPRDGAYPRTDASTAPDESVVDPDVRDRTDVVVTDHPDVTPRPDLRTRLAAIPGMTVEEFTQSGDPTRTFDLHFTQLVDHDDPSRGVFTQYLTLVHRRETGPTVLESTGYDNYVPRMDSELSLLLNANQVTVEHRFFGTSVPAPRDWSLLNIRQAAADHHEIVRALQGIYTGPWVSSGASKGGMTSLFHRRFFPDDVVATVAYVAPISFGAPDPRYAAFLETVGDAGCRQRLWDLETEMLRRRAAMLSRIDQLAVTASVDLSLSGGAAGVLESDATGLSWTFWQYSGITYCPTLPDPRTVTDDDLFGVLEQYSPVEDADRANVMRFLPYYYQAETQLGWGDVRTDFLQSLLTGAAGSTVDELTGTMTRFDATVMPDIQTWVNTSAERLMFIYGQWDPWTAGAVDARAARDSFSFTMAQGTHGAQLADLEPTDRALAFATLERWLGVRIRGGSPRTPYGGGVPRWHRVLPPGLHGHMPR